MFSRIQTLFLLLAVAATALSFVFPVTTGSIETTSFKYTNYGLYMLSEKGWVKAGDGYAYLVAAAALLFLLFALTQFKKRALQIRVCRLSYILILAQFAMYFFTSDPAQTTTAPARVTVQYDLAFFMPLVALICTFAAERFIRRDENLVRSADRLR